ncbi:MAG TPA: HD domain-containing protein [Candidatus Hydrogenedentes bacterium]|nr:HD domain-containing protein [Candidatus Hydrogenedentota bacterium]
MSSLLEHATRFKTTLQGRRSPLPPDKNRTEYERDAHRILYCDAFRRLRHKAQVFFMPNNDHICTRMEHVLHVAAAACTVARGLGLDEHLTQAIALGHDLGHAPFGHHGEKVLADKADELAAQGKLTRGGFQHEIHGLRVVDRLAQLDREDGPGLNLTYAVRDGIISHCGEDSATTIHPTSPEEKELESIKDKNDAAPPTTYEGCIVRIVDKIVYAGRDLEDALKAGLISSTQLEDELRPVTDVLGNNNGEMVGTLVSDLIGNGKKGQVALSANISDALKEMIEWNNHKIYAHPQVGKYKPHVEKGIKDLFERLLVDIEDSERFTNTDKLPKAAVYEVFREFIAASEYSDEESNEQIVLDFIAGMTDNYLIRCISELFLPRAIA